MKPPFILAGNSYTDTSKVPKDADLYYECQTCGSIIPSFDNGACECGNIVIDIDVWRLEVEDFTKFQVLRKVR